MESIPVYLAGRGRGRGNAGQLQSSLRSPPGVSTKNGTAANESARKEKMNTVSFQNSEKLKRNQHPKGIVTYYKWILYLYGY